MAVAQLLLKQNVWVAFYAELLGNSKLKFHCALRDELNNEHQRRQVLRQKHMSK
jgi:hypothetical protein